MPRYNAADWFWFVAGDETQVFSSAAAAFIPPTDATFVTFIADGGLPTRIGSFDDLLDVLRAQAPTQLPITPATLAELVTSFAQQRLDAFAQEKRYDNIVSLCSYQADDPDEEFAADGATGRAKRSATWSFLKQLEADVTATLQGGGALPTLDAVKAQLVAAVPLAWS